MKKMAMLIGLLLAGVSLVAAEGKDDNFDFTHNRFAFSGLLTSSCTYQLEASYHYMINPIVGVGGGAGLWEVYYEEGRAGGKDWELDNDSAKPMNLYLRPSVVLKSPALRVGQFDLGMYAEPGLLLNVPYASVNIRQFTQWPDYEYKHASTSRGQWLAVDVRLGVYANFGPCGLSAGYALSSHDVYSQYRHLSYKGQSFSKFYPSKPMMQGAYLTACYYF